MFINSASVSESFAFALPTCLQQQTSIYTGRMTNWSPFPLHRSVDPQGQVPACIKVPQSKTSTPLSLALRTAE